MTFRFLFVWLFFLFYGSLSLADPIGFTPVGGEFFGMGGAYTADYEDSTAILLNPAATVTPRKVKKKGGKAGPTSTVSTGFTGRLARRTSPDLIRISDPVLSTYGTVVNKVNLMSTGTTGRFQVSKYSFPLGLGVFLRDSMFTRLQFERIMGDAGRTLLTKDTDLYQGGVSAAIIMHKRWALGVTLKFFYGTAYTGRYVEHVSSFGPGISNCQYTRQMWGIGMSLGARLNLSQDLTLGLAVDLPNLRVYDRNMFRHAQVYRVMGLDTKYVDDYSQSGTRFSGPVIRMGLRWKPKKKWKLSADLTVNPWPVAQENDFAPAHILAFAIGASMNPTDRHKVAIGASGRFLSRADLIHPGDTRTWALSASMLYRYSSTPVRLPWVGKVIIRLAVGLRYTYTGGEIGGVKAYYTEQASYVSMKPAVLRFHALDTLFRIAIVY